MEEQDGVEAFGVIVFVGASAGGARRGHDDDGLGAIWGIAVVGSEFLLRKEV